MAHHNRKWSFSTFSCLCAVWCVHSYLSGADPLLCVIFLTPGTTSEVAKQFVATLVLLNLFIHDTHVRIDLCVQGTYTRNTAKTILEPTKATVIPFILWCTLFTIYKVIIGPGGSRAMVKTRARASA